MSAEPRAKHCMLSGPLYISGMATKMNALVSFFGTDGQSDSNTIRVFGSGSWFNAAGVPFDLAGRTKASCTRVNTNAGAMYMSFGGVTSSGQVLEEVLYLDENGNFGILPSMGRPSNLPLPVFSAASASLAGANNAIVTVFGGSADPAMSMGGSPLIHTLNVNTGNVSAGMYGSMEACPMYDTLSGALNGSSWIESLARCQTNASSMNSPGREHAQCGCLHSVVADLEAYTQDNYMCDLAFGDLIRARQWLESGECEEPQPSACVNFFGPAHESLTKCGMMVTEDSEMCPCTYSVFEELTPFPVEMFQECPAYEHFKEEANCGLGPAPCFANRADAITHCEMRRGEFAFTCDLPTDVECPEGTIYDGGDRGCVPLCAYYDSME